MPRRRADLIGQRYPIPTKADTPLATLVRVSGLRWPIEHCFEESKEEVDLDHYELRVWRGWHHLMTMVILAHHFLVRLRLRLAARGGRQQQRTEAPTPDPVVCLDGLPPSALPLPALDPALALALVAYMQRHNLAAGRSHRQRTLQRLAAQGP